MGKNCIVCAVLYLCDFFFYRNCAWSNNQLDFFALRQGCVVFFKEFSYQVTCIGVNRLSLKVFKPVDVITVFEDDDFIGCGAIGLCAEEIVLFALRCLSVLMGTDVNLACLKGNQDIGKVNVS